VDRRELLRRAVPLAAVGLAGCSGSGDGGDGTTTAPADTTTAPTETTTGPPTDGTATQTTEPTTAEPTPTTAEPAQSSVTVTVGPGGDLRFDPESFRLAAGGTVTWEWESSGHNVRPSSQPSGAEWSGTPGGDAETYASGYSYEHTFAESGRYEYYCNPHREFGMVGSFAVEERATNS